MTSTAETADTAGRPARNPLAVATATPARALTLIALAGVGISLQSYLNGRLSGQLGSLELASAVNNAVGWVALLTLGLASGSVRRALARLREGERPRPWMFVGGFCGAFLIAVSTAAAPKVGVALLTVALVCGQTGGSLPVDAAGISPAGRHGVTVPRLLGVGLAIAAVVISALGSGGDLRVGLLVLAVAAGLGVALQQAANGRLAQLTGEPGAAALANFTIGFVCLGTLALVVTWGDPIHWGGNFFTYLGGFLGAFFVLSAAAAVRTLGVLRLMLVSVAGQTAGALVIDLIAPVPGEEVGAATVIGLLLTVIAVFVSGRAREAS